MNVTADSRITIFLTHLFLMLGTGAPPDISRCTVVTLWCKSEGTDKKQKVQRGTLVPRLFYKLHLSEIIQSVEDFPFSCDDSCRFYGENCDVRLKIQRPL